jgi:AcrR family transcriptional regulator
MPTQHERKAATRRRLLEAAADLFARHGVDGVSVDAVAAAADRTSGAVYAHFGSKHGLLLALLDNWRTPLVTGVLSAIASAGDLRSRLEAVALALVVDPSPETRRLLLLEQELRRRAERDAAVADALATRARSHYRWLAQGLRRWQRAGWVTPDRPADELAVAFSATVTGLAADARLSPASVPLDAAVRTLAAALGVEVAAAAAVGPPSPEEAGPGTSHDDATPHPPRRQPVTTG